MPSVVEDFTRLHANSPVGNTVFGQLCISSTRTILSHINYLRVLVQRKKTGGIEMTMESFTACLNFLLH